MSAPTSAPRVSYVLDTCVLLADPQAIHRFDEHEVVLPLVVVEELDRQKARMDEVGRNARSAIRLIEELRVVSSDGLTSPVALPGGGVLRIEANHVDQRLPGYLDPMSPDNRILAIAIALRGTLVTKDAALRIKASQLGALTEDYRADQVHVDHHYTGIDEVEVDGQWLGDFHTDGKGLLVGAQAESRWVNQCLVLRCGPSGSGLARVTDVRDDEAVVQRVAGSPRAFGVQPRDVRQTFALEQVVEQSAYRRLSVYRPLVAVGRQEVGFLPGDLDEKLSPWMAAVHDNLYSLFRRDADSPFNDRTFNDSGHVQRMVDSLLDRGQLEMAAITYLRGRSITDEFVIVDEAQNLELPTLKVILTRMAAGSKVVFCGDLSQIDNPYISPFGGMAALIEKLKGTALFGHVTMAKGVRSPLAELAATSF
jgi:PhoH-like ATPase